jgi:NO-binding membrane sensor protein with MHYT domain
MEPVTEPLPLQYDLALALLALSFAAAASIVCFIGLSHLTGRGRKTSWLALTTLCAGAGIWTAHILAALSLEADARGFDPYIGALAFAAALAGAGAGIAVTMQPGRAMAACGGAVIGAGIAAAHLIGMSAFSFAATPAWEPALRALAGALAIALAAGATLSFREFKDKTALLSGAALLTGAITACLAVATAGFALMDEPPDTPAYPPLDAHLLIIGATTFTGAVLLATLLLAFIERQAARAAIANLGELMDAAIEGFVLADDGRIVGVNARLLELSGCKASELIGKRIFGDLLTGRRRMAAPGATFAVETKLIGKVDKSIPVQAVRRPLQAFAGASEVFAIRDLRERIQATRRIEQLTGELGTVQADLNRRNVLLEHVLGGIGHGVCLFDAKQRVVIANDRYSTLYDLPPEAAQPGSRLRDIVQKRIDKGLFAGASPTAYMAERLAPVETTSDTLHKLSDGRLIAIHQRPVPGGGWITAHDDVTEQHRKEEERLQQADIDTLTELPNRGALRRLLTGMLAPALEKGRKLAVLMLNLDHFREVNRALGHRTGDALLKAIAERLRSNTRQATLLARVGDDEFVIVEAVARRPAAETIGLDGAGNIEGLS